MGGVKWSGGVCRLFVLVLLAGGVAGTLAGADVDIGAPSTELRRCGARGDVQGRCSLGGGANKTDAGSGGCRIGGASRASRMLSPEVRGPALKFHPLPFFRSC